MIRALAFAVERALWYGAMLPALAAAPRPRWYRAFKALGGRAAWRLAYGLAYEKKGAQR